MFVTCAGSGRRYGSMFVTCAGSGALRPPGPVAAALVPRCALLPAPSPRDVLAALPAVVSRPFTSRLATLRSGLSPVHVLTLDDPSVGGSSRAVLTCADSGTGPQTAHVASQPRDQRASSSCRAEGGGSARRGGTGREGARSEARAQLRLASGGAAPPTRRTSQTSNRICAPDPAHVTNIEPYLRTTRRTSQTSNRSAPTRRTSQTQRTIWCP